MKTVQIANETYVPVFRASEILGYSRDYVGQLCRSGSLVCKRSSGQWFVLEENVVARSKKGSEVHTTTPKSVEPVTEKTKTLDEEGATPVHKIKTGNIRDDVLFFDKEEYVTSARAAEITGYAQDYVGELARSKAVVARKVGRHWMIHKKSIIDHKKEKDALLAGVQDDSAGFSGAFFDDMPGKGSISLMNTRYFSEDNTPLPNIAQNRPENGSYNNENGITGFDDIKISTGATKNKVLGAAEQFFPNVSSEMYTVPISAKNVRASNKGTVSENGLHKPKYSISDERYGANLPVKRTVAHDSPYAVTPKEGSSSFGRLFVVVLIVGIVLAGYWYRDTVVYLAQDAYTKVQNSSVYALLLDIVPGRGVEYFSE